MPTSVANWAAAATVESTGAFWGWLFGLILSFVAAAGGTIVRREDGMEVFKTRVVLTLTGIAVMVRMVRFEI